MYVILVQLVYENRNGINGTIETIACIRVSSTNPIYYASLSDVGQIETCPGKNLFKRFGTLKGTY